MNTPSFDLSGKVAILTGASKGIGEAMAYAFGKAGAKIVVSSRKQEAVDEVVANFRKEGIEAVGIACNVGNMDDLPPLVQGTLEAFGAIDILVNNAGTNPHYGPINTADLGAWDKIMDVNLKGAFELGRQVHPHMKAQGGGAIINIASVAGYTPGKNMGIYSISKAALMMLTKVTAQEYGADGIRVNAICPGFVKTKLSQAIFDDPKLLQSILRQQSVAHEGQPEDIAGLALLLASEAGRFIAGQCILADGGMWV